MRNPPDRGHGGIDLPRFELEAWPAEHLIVLGEHRGRDIEGDMASEGQHQDGGFGAGRRQ